MSSWQHSALFSGCLFTLVIVSFAACKCLDSPICQFLALCVVLASFSESPWPCVRLNVFCPRFPSSDLELPGLTSRSLIHFELVLVQGKRRNLLSLFCSEIDFPVPLPTLKNILWTPAWCHANHILLRSPDELANLYALVQWTGLRDFNKEETLVSQS